jgi:hypothetical protein
MFADVAPDNGRMQKHGIVFWADGSLDGTMHFQQTCCHQRTRLLRDHTINDNCRYVHVSAYRIYYQLHDQSTSDSLRSSLLILFLVTHQFIHVQ